MKTHEVFAKMVRGSALEFAKILRLNVRTIYKWMEPTVDFSDSGALNPLDRIETCIETAQRLGHPPEDAQAPILYLAARFNGTYLPGISHHETLEQLQAEVCHAVSDFGDLMRSLGDAMSPASTCGPNISPDENRQITTKGLNVLHSVAALLRAVDDVAGPRK